MRKKALFLLSLYFILNSISVSALNNESTYINKNGIELTESEFNFINDFYGSDFFEAMTDDDYNWIIDLDVNNRSVKIERAYDYSNSNLLRGSSHSTKSKSLSIAKACYKNECTVITKLKWLINPNVRSYDLIGVRFYNTALNDNTITTRLNSSNGTEYSYNNKVLGDGLGTSVKLPNGATDIYIEQKIFTNSGGTVYASYQHATSNISLSTSMKYQIGSSGLGSVFIPYGDAIGKFDKMQGVEIDL